MKEVDCEAKVNQDEGEAYSGANRASAPDQEEVWGRGVIRRRTRRSWRRI